MEGGSWVPMKPSRPLISRGIGPGTGRARRHQEEAALLGELQRMPLGYNNNDNHTKSNNHKTNYNNDIDDTDKNASTSSPKLPFQTSQMPSNRDPKALTVHWGSR